VFVEGNGPDPTPRDGIRIRDTAPVVPLTGDGVQLKRPRPRPDAVMLANRRHQRLMNY
jgi:hypothetical protein